METNTNIAELVKGVGGLVTLPNVFIRINQLVEDPNSRYCQSGEPGPFVYRPPAAGGQ